MSRTATIGIVLCGGESRRMGTDKGKLVYKSQQQRYLIYQMLQEFCEEVYLSVRPGQETDIADSYRYFCDLDKYRNAGPMTAVLSAFDTFPGKNLLVAGCDYVNLEKEAFPPLYQNDQKIHCYRNEDGYAEPLIAFYPAGVVGNLIQAYENGEHSLRHFCQKEMAVVHKPAKASWLFSMDTPEQRQLYMDSKQLHNPSSRGISILKYRDGALTQTEDFLVSEEPLEIRLAYTYEGKRLKKNISVTMRTPGHDAELALGFLFTEGIIKSIGEVTGNHYAHSLKHGEKENIIQVELADRVKPEMERLERHFYTTSSCGVCGKTSIELVRQAAPAEMPAESWQMPASVLLQLPDTLRKSQEIFENTGGLHAAALFTPKGEMLVLREDIGRHNAVDKVIGYGLQQGTLPFDKHVLLLSGRGGFELIQKSIMAGIKVIASVGAPSSLSVEMAREFNVTLIGFLKSGRFNIYSGEERIDVSL